MLESQDSFVSLSKASRRFALPSFVGLLIIFGALAYASIKLQSLEKRTGDLTTEISTNSKPSRI